MTPPPDDHDCGWKKYAEAQAETLAALQSQLAAMSAEIATLKEQAAAARKARFGKKSERQKPERLPPPIVEKPAPEETQQRRRESALLRDLSCDTVDETIPLGAAACSCAHCGGAHLTELPSRPSVVYVHIPERIQKRVYRQQTVKCRDCGHIAKAPPPERFGEKGRFSSSFVAHLLYTKWVSAIPQHRLEKAYRSLGIPLARSTICDLSHRAADELRVIYDRAVQVVRDDPHVHADETTMKQQDLDKKSFFWTFHGRKLVVYRYATTRSGKVPEEMLGDSAGTLVVDLYKGYDRLFRNGNRLRGGCMAHARRHLFKQKPHPEVEDALQLIQELYLIERAAKKKGIEGAALLQERRLKSRPVLARLFWWARKMKRQHEPSSGMAKAVRYLLDDFRAYTLFLDYAEVPLDNNAAERDMRRITMGRDTYRFVGNESSGHDHAVLYSLAGSCELNGVNPREYFEDVLMRVRKPGTHIDDLLPHRWKPQRAGPQLPSPDR